MTRQRQILVFLPVILFIVILSLRQVSDPDIGFHLKYGEMVSTEHSVPLFDKSTYTVSDHRYIDLHWIFQLMVYKIRVVGGYPAISIFFCIAGLVIMLLLFLRNRHAGIKPAQNAILLLLAFIIIDPRLAPRPEMVTFIFLLIFLFIFDLYRTGNYRLVFVLPPMMLLWCNMHALFIIGPLVFALFLVSETIRFGRVEKNLFVAFMASLAACMANPYGLEGVMFPFKLVSRFNSSNIFNQHIQEFTPLFSQSVFLVRDYLLFFIMAASIALLTLKFRKEKLFDLALFILFFTASVMAVRNTPLFVLAILPVTGSVFRLADLHAHREGARIKNRRLLLPWLTPQRVSKLTIILAVALPLCIIPRLITNAWYIDHGSFNKTGIGVNSHHLPVNATEFMKVNRLEGRILNSLGFGGWLSWQLPQPVFIDGRLEVMEEKLYGELTASWRGELEVLIDKYRPAIIVYNYLKYFPWTLQLREMKDWRPVYADGISAIYLRTGYKPGLATISLEGIPPLASLNTGGSNKWWQGFFIPADYRKLDTLHLSLFAVQSGIQGKTGSDKRSAAELFNRGNERYAAGDFHEALALYDSAIRLNPGYLKAINNRAILLASEFNEHERAISEFGRVIKADPSNADAYLGRGSVYFMMEDLRGASRDWQSACRLGNQRACRLLEQHAARK